MPAYQTMIMFALELRKRFSLSFRSDSPNRCEAEDYRRRVGSKIQNNPRCPPPPKQALYFAPFIFAHLARCDRAIFALAAADT